MPEARHRSGVGETVVVIGEQSVFSGLIYELRRGKRSGIFSEATTPDRNNTDGISDDEMEMREKNSRLILGSFFLSRVGVSAYRENREANGHGQLALIGCRVDVILRWRITSLDNPVKNDATGQPMRDIISSVGEKIARDA
ncbi:hypothetical protein K0M31_003912 [Melipona bicolor]|uniref:Uncharacterized protein n=1 Tax=Melipona bicolor TaxID=60889 RepID=A0AA40FYS9_9HYME|nr:hypothetical protein K0M31_003912 [Melipona bicolor]